MSQLKECQHLKITFQVIKEATKNFKDCIGKGGYGRVYKGELLISGHLTTVAVKRLYEQFGQGSKEFLTEIELLKGQKHTNLISLLGYCEEGDEKIIVYEYVERGSLDQYLRRNTTTYTLTWLERLQICVDIARGLDHLHNHAGRHQAIIHRDIKSANILLDHNWVAKISDLGLSKLSLAGLDRSAVISYACGTPGYCEPEYMITGVVKKESDVFSFGMLLLEILCGRLCTIRDADGLLLSDYYKMKKLPMIIDPILRQQMSSDSLIRFLTIAYGCLHEDRIQRYPINLVVKKLEETLKYEISLVKDNGKKSGLISSDDLQGWISEYSFSTLIARRTKDGGLSRQELAGFLFVTHGEEQLITRLDEVFSVYHKYIDGKKGLTYHGLLQYYDDGHSNLDSDIVPLVSESDDSSNRKKMMWLLQKLSSKKDGGVTGDEIAARKSLHETIGGLLFNAFNWYRKRGLTSDSRLKLHDGSKDQLDLDSEVLELLLRPDEDKAAFSLSTPESLVTTKPWTMSELLLYVGLFGFVLQTISLLGPLFYFVNLY